MKNRSISPLLDALMTRAVKLTAGVNCRNGGGNRLLILCYHRVLAEPDPIQPEGIDRASFSDHMHALGRSFNVLGLADAVRQLREGTLPPRAVCITFDDGYADNCEIALPILRAHGFPATVFIATGMLDGGCMWNDSIVESIRVTSKKALGRPLADFADVRLDSTADRARAVKSILLRLRRLTMEERKRIAEEIVDTLGSGDTGHLMLSTEQVRELHRNGIEIGAHTVTHPILTRLNDDEARREIRQSRQTLADVIDAEVHGFAYPNGVPGLDFDRRHIDAVAEAGYTYAVSTAAGTSDAAADVFQLPRFKPWQEQAGRFGLRLALAYRMPMPGTA